MKVSRLLFLFTIFYFIASSVLAFEVSPNIIEETIQPGKIKIAQIQVKNTDSNATHSYVLSVSGNVSQYVILDDNDFELPPLTSKVVKIYFIIPEDIQEGTYFGNILVDETDTNATTKQVYLKVTINPWVFSTTKWIDVPSILYIDSYKFNITFTSDKNGVIINNQTMYRDDEKLFYDNIKIKIIDINRESSQIYIKIDSKIRNPSISIKKIETKKKEEYEVPILQGEVELYPSEITKRIQKGAKSSSIVLYLYNGLNYPVKIERVDYYGDVFEFEDGTTEPIYDIKLPQSKILEPGDEVPIIVKLSANKLDPGRYTVTLTLTYRVGRKLKHENAILEIVVFKSQYQAMSELSVLMPDVIEKGKDFSIEVRGVTRSYDVKVRFSNNECVTGSGSLSDNVYIYKGKLTCDTDNLTITVDIYKEGILVRSVSKEYIIKKNKEKPKAPKPMYIKIEPPNPRPGDTVRIYAVDEKGNILNAIIKVNGLPMTTFIAEPKKTYTIEATLEGYTPASRIIKVPGKKFVVTITPSNPKVNDTVTIIVKDQQTGQQVPATIKVNGKSIAGNTFVPDHEGVYTITIEHPEYDTVTKTISVILPLKVNVTTSKVKVGDKIIAYANKKVYWIVYYQSPKSNETKQVYVSSQPSDKLEFAVDKPGTYIIDVGGKKYYVKAVSYFVLNKRLLIDGLLFIILVLLIGIIIKKRRRRFRLLKVVKSKSDLHVEPPATIGEQPIEKFPAIPMSEKEKENIEKLEK